MSNLDRRDFLGALAAGAGLAQTRALEGAVGNPGERSSRRGGKPKNVLLLMSDQHTPTALGANGDSVAHTPNLDALARSGVRFEHAYCTNPVCLPSRASMLTGLYTHHNGCYSNETPWPYEHKTLAHYFHDSGYMTSLIGKMHFDDGQTHGFDYHLDFNEWFQYLGPKTKIWADELGFPNDGAGQPQIPELWSNGDPWAGVRIDDAREGHVAVGRVSHLAEEDHFESFVARESIRFLRTYGKKGPFMLISSFLKPHGPFMPAGRFASMFNPGQMKLPASWGKVDLSTVPRVIRKSIEWPGGTPELRHPENVRIRLAMYYAQLAQTDDCIGKVLATLRELGLEDDTIVVYTADHGEMLGRHGLWAKFVFYDPSVGVPLLFRVPGMTAQNVQCNTPVSQVQMLATLTELCGLPIPPSLDGGSFAASLQHPHQTLDTTVFAEFATHSKEPRFMIRHGDYKYCYYVGDMAELYDLRNDPQEMKNLALLPAYREKVSEMKQRLFAWHRP